jgi:hypothetical protein
LIELDPALCATTIIKKLPTITPDRVPDAGRRRGLLEILGYRLLDCGKTADEKVKRALAEIRAQVDDRNLRERIDGQK